jgi:hypothetical protein
MNGMSFEAVLHDVRCRADQMLPDVIVHLAELRMDERGHLQAPNTPTYRLNDWSQKQLASKLGLRWNRWFELSTPVERAEEVNRRLARMPGQGKIRAFRDTEGQADGVARALLSPTATPIDDSRVFEQLASPIFRAGIDEFHFTRVAYTDSTSHYTAVHRQSFFLRGDELYPGFHLRNSEVGGAAFSLDDHWLRLVCMNGLMARVGNARLLYRTHRTIDTDVLAAALVTALRRLPDRWKATFEQFEKAKETSVPHPDAAVAAVLDSASVPRDLVAEAQKTVLRDGDHTRFGVVQAITWVAHQVNQDPNVRFLMEQRAGEYLMAA